MVSLLLLGGVKNGRWVSSLGQRSHSRPSMPPSSSLLCIPLVAGDQGLTQAQKGPPSPFECPPTWPPKRAPLSSRGPTATSPPSGHPGEMHFPNPRGILGYNPWGGETGQRGAGFRRKLMVLSTTPSLIVKWASQ